MENYNTERVACEAPIAQKVNRDVRIETLNYGYIVRIDCHSFAIETTAKLNEKLNEWFLNPEQTEKNWFENKKI